MKNLLHLLTAPNPLVVADARMQQVRLDDMRVRHQETLRRAEKAIHDAVEQGEIILNEEGKRR